MDKFIIQVSALWPGAGFIAYGADMAFAGQNPILGTFLVLIAGGLFFAPLARYIWEYG